MPVEAIRIPFNLNSDLPSHFHSLISLFMVVGTVMWTLPSSINVGPAIVQTSMGQLKGRCFLSHVGEQLAARRSSLTA